MSGNLELPHNKEENPLGIIAISGNRNLVTDHFQKAEGCLKKDLSPEEEAREKVRANLTIDNLIIAQEEENLVEVFRAHEGARVLLGEDSIFPRSELKEGEREVFYCPNDKEYDKIICRFYYMAHDKEIIDAAKQETLRIAEEMERRGTRVYIRSGFFIPARGNGSFEETAAFGIVAQIAE